MGYRMAPPPPPKNRRTFQDTATPSRVYAHNGTTVALAIPCWYQEVHWPIRMQPHNRPLHDHMGWPNPGFPDRSCQLYEPFEAGYPPEPPHTTMGGRPPVRKLLDMTKVFPIHLSSEYEGYNAVRVSFIDDHDGITASAEIDSEQDWIVRVNFEIKDKNAYEEPQTYRFTVFADAPAKDRFPKRSDIVCLGELIVLPSAY